MQFIDISQNTNEWNRGFGDGTANSYEQNPEHTYYSVGNYTVTLNATNGTSCGTITKIGYILVETGNTESTSSGS